MQFIGIMTLFTFTVRLGTCIHVWLLSIVVGIYAGIPNVLPLQPVAIVNSPLLLFCYSNGDSGQIRWLKNNNQNDFIGSCAGDNIGYNVTCNSLRTESRIEIEIVRVTDLGSNWTCIAEYYDGSKRPSNTVTLYEQTIIDSVAVRAAIDDRLVDINDVTANASDTLTVNCIKSPAYPDPFIKWYISHDADISSDYIELEDTQSTNSTRGPNGTVTLNSKLVYNIVRDDNGKQIQCMASNNYSLNSSPRLRLNIQYRANISTFTLNTVKRDNDTSVDVIRGSSLSYRCAVDSNPPARITLSRGTTTLKVIESGNVLMHEKEIATSDDEGMYTCNARNPVFNFWTNEQINVAIVYGAKITLFLVNNERYESNVTLNETGSLRMICTVDSKPDADVYIGSTNTKCQTTQSGYSVCDVNSIKCEEHAGLYTCHANNPLGADSRSIGVFINCIPMITKKSKEYVALIINDTVTLTVTITAYPVPDVFWTLPNSLITFAACQIS